MAAGRTIPIHALTADAGRADGADRDGADGHDTLANPGRRALLRLMAASAALAGAGCSGPPSEVIVPYANMPEAGQTPGEPVFYASAVVRDGYAHGVLVHTNGGRPTKIEGNPLHPMSLGATDAFAQASILQMWDPDRSRAIMRQDDIDSWDALRNVMSQRQAQFEQNGGQGLGVLTGTVSFPTMLRQLDALKQKYPRMRWHRHDPVRDAAAEEGAHMAMGAPIRAMYRLEQASMVLAVGADLFSDGAPGIRYARDFMQARKRDGDRARLYAIEAAPGLTGAVADQRWALPCSEMEAVIHRLAHALDAVAASDDDPDRGQAHAWEAALADQLRGHAGRCLVAAGPALSARAHAQVWAINIKLGNVGRTVLALPIPGPMPGGIGELTRAMQQGQVDTLLIIDANPVYDTPGILGFAQALRHVRLSIHAGLYRDETGRATNWHVPRAHDFEDWSDACAWDGTAGIVQPVIAPLHGGRSPHVLLGLLIDGQERSAHAQVQATWRTAWGTPADFDAKWNRSLRKGFIEASPPAAAAMPQRPPSSLSPAPPAAGDPKDALIALFVVDRSVGAGAWSNNGWLQELPRPLTQLTWDNAAFMAERTARALGVDTGDVITLRAGHGATLDAPVFVLPGHAEGAVSLPLGYGRTAAGRVGDGVGFDAYRLQSTDEQGQPLASTHVVAIRTGRRHDFARVQTETSMHGRDLVRTVDLATMNTPLPKKTEPSLYPPVAYPDYAWGMSINLDSCIGCNACTIACQSENNIPVVGKDQVAVGREMHWIRVDLYRDAAAADSPERTLFQPVPCMHCEDAPCELVCPVGATVHDSEGLNAQVYNRCVGTRFCSNNCPYKVRRFNFYAYADQSEEAAAHENPDVTVRRRGVMEKCTYCVQRISRARIEAEKGGRAIRDGEVVTACEAVCPTQAIVFGNINDPNSRVSQAKRSPRDYALLEELNTRPRTTYLARVDNPGAHLESGDE